MVSIDEILRHALDREASDIHIKVGSPPFLRRFGHLAEDDGLPILSPDDVQSLVDQMVDDAHR